MVIVLPFTGLSQITKQINQYKAYEPTISDAEKLKFFPSIDDSTAIKRTLNYSIHSEPLLIDFNLTPVKPAKVEDTYLKKLYRTYIKIGFGNYLTPLADIRYNSLYNKNYVYGAYFQHLSSSGKIKFKNDKLYAGYSNNTIGFYGKKFIKNKRTISGSVDLNRNMYYYYGRYAGYGDVLNTEKDSLDKQNILCLKVNTGLKNNYTDSNHFNFNTNIDYLLLNDYYANMEHQIKFSGDFNMFNDDELYGVKTYINFFNTSLSTDTITRGLVNIKPYAKFVGDDWRIDAGLEFVADAYQDSLQYYFYPSVQIQYNVIENFLIPYVGYTGFLENNTYYSTLHELPFIHEGIYVRNANHKIVLYGGLKGNFSPNITYNTKVSYSVIEDNHFFCNENIFTNRFSVIYDDIELVQLHGEIVYKKQKKWNFILQGNSYNYSMTYLTKPWNKPQYDGTLTVQYNLRDKIILSSDFYTIGKRTTFFPVNSINEEYELDPVYDFNIGMEYRYSKILSGFIKLNNITSSKYQIWWGYPVQGFNILFGLTYSL
ncbi:MAG: TonB-dependent receptor [Marinilabiliales bacterium]